MSDLPMKQEDHPAHDMPTATQHYSGDTIDNSIDLSDGEGGAYSLGQYMQGEKASNDLQEKQAGTRFHDNGDRIPGKQKGLNDKYMDRPALLKPLLGGRF